MTRPEFMGQFDRLCVGFRYSATQEQSEAWFRKIGHHALADWAEAVSTLLCAPRFPLLDPVLAALDEAAQHRRKVEIDRNRRQDSRLAHTAQFGGGGNPLSPTLMAAIKAHSERELIRHWIDQAQHSPRLEPMEREAELKQLRAREQGLTDELCRVVPKLAQDELSDFMARYGAAVAA